MGVMGYVGRMGWGGMSVGKGGAQSAMVQAGGLMIYKGVSGRGECLE